MAKISTLSLCAGSIIAIITIIILFWSFPGYTSQNQARSDLVRIRLLNPPGDYQMPAVLFLHDRHTEALEQPSCEPCHFKEKNIIVFKFKRIKDQSFKTDQELYHNECIKCHTDRRGQELKSGPLTAECRRCHSQNLAYIDTAQPFGMDKSLHYRHVLADPIRPAGNEKDGNCSACHHEYDQTLKQTVYKKGLEGTCRYCHKQAKTEKARSFKTVAHEDCLNCHFELKLQAKKAGPTICAACHDSARQAGIAKIEKIPRIKRNQPDAVLLSTWLQEALASGKPSNQFVEAVAFNHLSHEKQVENCRACHHESLEPCAVCHTRTGTEKSKFFRLQQAMHSADNLKSCLGCHRESMKSADCAGCHAQRNARQFDEIKCRNCHTVMRESLKPLPKNNETRARIAATQINALAAPGPAIPDEKIPDKVTIGIMEDQYDRVLFPHRQIVRTLIKRTQKSLLTQYFHRGTASLCSGCHHHGPSAGTYPKCAACHSLSLKSDQNGKPGLKGAYHGQCITCHQRMGIEKPASTDCTACHKKKTTTVQRKD